MTIIEVLDKTDWTELAKEKLALLNAIAEVSKQRAAAGEEPHILEGLVNWIDAVQDAAYDHGYPVEWLTEKENER